MFTLLIWDLPTRLFHGALAACVAGLIISGHWGGSAMVWHFRFGYCVLTLLLFRLVWGVVGGHWSRWAQLPTSARQLWAYIRPSAARTLHAGHNPLGALSIIAMLTFLSFQVLTGLISDDEIANIGPLAQWAPGAWVSWATSWHKSWGKWAVMLLIALHVAALLWYKFARHESLVPAMLHGHKVLPHSVKPSQDGLPQRLLALLLLVLSSIVVGWLVTLDA